MARLTGATAEFLRMWSVMLAGEKPFFLQDGQLCLAFRQLLPGWLFDEHSTVTFEFRGGCRVVYHNPGKRDTFTGGGLEAHRMALRTHDDREVELDGCVIGPPRTEMVRSGQVQAIQVFFD